MAQIKGIDFFQVGGEGSGNLWKFRNCSISRVGMSTLGDLNDD